jgi:hypothetical protein
VPDLSRWASRDQEARTKAVKELEFSTLKPYVQERLAAWSGWLPKAVMRRWGESYDVFIQVSDPVDIASLPSNMRLGGVYINLWPEEDEDQWQGFTTSREFLGKDPSNVILFEDTNSAPTDPWLERAKDWLIIDERVYLYSWSDSTDEELSKNLEGNCDPYIAWVAFVHGCRDFIQRSERKRLPMPEAQIVADQTEFMAMSVYDGEGYLILRPSDRAPKVEEIDRT